ncbi:MAG: hypothetical protein Q8O84_00400, partial [Nanoarchaeota archaeon]|nr:hypothetical protein [Nanoarchaeota archaeon]
KIIDKNSAKFGLEILGSLEKTIVKLDGKNPNIDIKIANYLKGEDIILATMDKELKKRIGNNILIVRGKRLIVV